MIHRVLFLLLFTVLIASTAKAQDESPAAASGAAPGTAVAEGDLAEPPEPVYPDLFDAARVDATPEVARPLLAAANAGIDSLRSEVTRAAAAGGNQRTQIVVKAAEATQAEFRTLSSEWMESSVGEEDAEVYPAIAGALGRTTQVDFELFLGRRLGEANLVDQMIANSEGTLALSALVASAVPDAGPAPVPDPEADPVLIASQMKTYEELQRSASEERVKAYREIMANRDLGESTLKDLLAAVRAYHEERDQARATAAARPASSGLRPAAADRN